MNGRSGTSSGKDGRLGRRVAESFDARREDALDDVVARGDPEYLRKGLTTRCIQMIAFGGAIGTDLFYGSAAEIKLAGPLLLLAYVLGGIVIFFVVRAMGEMSVHRPSLGSFSRYASDYWSPRTRFVAGWNYQFNYIAVAVAELTVVGRHVQYRFSSVPAWASAVTVLLVITAVNLVGVKAFGEFEFWFSAIKVVVVVGMIVLGLYVIVVGVNSNPHLPDPSFGHLFGDSFLTEDVTGLLASLALVMFFFGGIELIRITAGEAENPQWSIPKTVNQVVYRILIFYIGALTIVMAVVPWRQINGKLSPFVQIFGSVGISVAARVLNFAVLTAALSVHNLGLYPNGRVLYSLARQGDAPKASMHLFRRGILYTGVLFSPMMTAVAVAIIYFLPETVSSILMAMVLDPSIISWVMTLLIHGVFRRRVGSDVVDLALKLPGSLASNGVALACLVGVFILMAFNLDHRTSVAAISIRPFVLFVAYEGKKGFSRPGMSADWAQES